jgi:hypothetical protein
MKVRYIFVFVFVAVSLLQINSYAQSFGLGWKCDYATWDEQPNSTGYNTVSVAAIKENTFVALVLRSSNSTNYIVGYTDADSGKGRMGSFLYGSALAGYKTPWTQGFDEVVLNNAYDLAAGRDSLIYIANNDAEKNILVFKMTKDTIETTDYRMVTGANSLWAIDVDKNGRVFVTDAGDSLTAGKVLIFNSIKNDPVWGDMHNSLPMQTITVPEAGELRGITVNGDGSIIYVSNYMTKKIYCYIGSPSTGYTLYNGFNFTLTETKVGSDNSIIAPGPWGLKFMDTKNILMAAASVSFKTGTGYEFSKIYFINPNTGVIVDSINCSQWNYDHTGSYQSRTSGMTPGNVSGYASAYNIDFDENFNVYSQSYYGWTVDKWSYNGTIPVIPLTITSVEKLENPVPSGFRLEQNYPNPFNPSTQIEFSLNEDSYVSLSVYSVTGELVTELIKNTSFSKGSYKVTLDASKLASGTYIYSLKGKNGILSKKMMLVK